MDYALRAISGGSTLSFARIKMSRRLLPLQNAYYFSYSILPCTFRLDNPQPNIV